MPDLSGLSEEQARRALAEAGFNEVPGMGKHSRLKLLLEVLSEPTLLALVAVLAVYVAMGSAGEAALLGLFVLLVIAIAYLEEGRTRDAVEALGRLASPRALVLRDGVWRRAAGREVAPGDLIKLAEGDRVPADVEMLEAHDLRTDESMLTGEGAAVPKLPGDRAFSGCLVLSGHGYGRVVGTGVGTRLGALSRSLEGIEPEPTPFQAAARRTVRALGWAAAASCLGAVALGWFEGRGLLESLLPGLTLAVALVPEELPVVLTVFMALGARRLSRHRVLVRRLPAVESLGAISLLAVDKTGTLTLNRMRLAKVLPAPGVAEGTLLAAAARACEPDPFDPMEQEILARAGLPVGRLERDYGLRGRPPRMGHLWSGGVLSVKGAPEGVL